MRILGIDPGIRNTGWGVIEQVDNRLSHVANGVIKPAPGLPDADRLLVIAKDLDKVITAYRPGSAAIEEIFVARSAASALKLGMARGVALMLCGQACLPVHEIAARRVKKSVTGTGTADKTQIQAMVKRLLGVEAANADAADALAIAIAAGHDTPIDRSRHDQTSSAKTRSNKTGINSGAPLGLGVEDASGGGLQAAIDAALARQAKEGDR